MARTTVRGSQIRDDSVEIVDLSDFAVVAGTGLNVNFHAGRVRSNTTVTDVSAGSLLLSDNTTSYVEVDSAGTVSANTTGFTVGQIPLATVVTSGGAITTVNDKRTWLPSSLGTETTRKPYHGIESFGALSFDNSTKALTVASGANTYWYKGTKYTTAAAIVCDLDLTADRDNSANTLTTNKLYYFYFKDATGKLYWSDSSWNFFNNVFVATVFWNGSAGACQRETHNHTRDIDWHLWAHDTIGTRYESGLTLTNPTTVNDALLQIETGTIHDEDIDFTTGQMTTMRCWHKASASVYTFLDYSLPYCGTSGAPSYLRTTDYTLQPVGANNFAVYWVYVSLDVNRPLHIVPTHAAAVYNSLVSARLETPPSLLGLNINTEMKLVYKFIFKGDGEFQESVDYRSTSPVPGGGTGTVTAGSVSVVPAGNIASTNAQAALEELDTEKAPLASPSFTTQIATPKIISASGNLEITPAAGLDWTTGNVIYVPIGGDISAYITAATAGDTLVLAAGTYTVTSAIQITKSLNIVGQGIGQTIITTSSNITILGFQASNTRIANMSLTNTNVGASARVCTVVTTEITGLLLENLYCTTSIEGNSATALLTDASGTIRNCEFYNTSVGAHAGATIPLYIVVSSTATPKVWNLFNVKVVSADNRNDGLVFACYVQDSGSASTLTVNAYDCTFTASGGSTGSQAIRANGDGAIANLYGCTMNAITATSADVCQATSGTMTLHNCTLVNNTTSGTINYGTTSNNSLFKGGNIKYVPLTDGTLTQTQILNNAITNATAGDTLVLAAGTYTITSTIVVNKLVRLVGQGIGITTVTTATKGIRMFTVSLGNGILMSDMAISNSAALDNGSDLALIYTSASNLRLERISFSNTATGDSTTNMVGISTVSSGSTFVENCIYSATGAIGYHPFFANATALISTIRGCSISGSGGTTSGYGNAQVYSSAAGAITNIYDSTIADTSAQTGGLIFARATTATINVYNSVLNSSGSGAFDVKQADTATVALYNTVLVNNTTSGTISYVNGTSIAKSGKIYYSYLGEDLNALIASAKITTGDTIILASGVYTVSDNISVAKSVNIIGQGIGKTTVTCATASKNIFNIPSGINNVRIANMTITNTGGTGKGINATYNITGLVFENLAINLSGAGANYAINMQSASGTVRDCVLIVSSSDTSALGLYVVTVAASSTVDAYNVYSSVTGGGGSVPSAFVSRNANVAGYPLLNLYNCTGITNPGTIYDRAVACTQDAAGANIAILNAYNCIFNGHDTDVVQNYISVCTIYNCVLVNGTTLGTITYAGTNTAKDIKFTGHLIGGDGTISPYNNVSNGSFETYAAGLQSPFTTLLLHMDGADSGTSFIDSSARANTVTVTAGAHTHTAVKKFGTASGAFNGTTDALTLPSDQKLSNGSFETWTGLTDLLTDGGLENWTTPTNLTSWSESGVGATFDREGTITKEGTYSCKITRAGANAQIAQDIASPSTYDGKTVVFGAWVKTDVANSVYLLISTTPTASAASAYHSGSGNWEYLTVTITLGTSLTLLRLRAIVAVDGVAYVDGMKLYEMLSPTSWILSGTGATVVREPGTIKVGTYSMKLTRNGTNAKLTQIVSATASYASRTVTFGCWVYATAATSARSTINDGIGETDSSYHSGTPGWEYLTVTRTCSASATILNVYLSVNTSDTSAWFDGSFVTDDATANFNFLGGDWTIDTWAYFTDVTTASYRSICAQYNGTTKERSFYLTWNQSDSSLYLFYSVDGTTVLSESVSWTPTINTFYHIEVARSGNSLYFFVNGTQVGTTKNVTGITLHKSNEVFSIGAIATSTTASNFFIGYLDEFRVRKGVAAHTASFTPPTIPYGNTPTGWTLAGAGAEVDIATDIVKLGTYSAKLTRNGTDCLLYYNVLGTTAAALSSKAVTFGCWVYASTASTAKLVAVGYGTTTTSGIGDFHPGDSTWRFLSVTFICPANTTTVSVQCYSYANAPVYFDGAMLNEGYLPFAFSEPPALTNSDGTTTLPKSLTLTNGDLILGTAGKGIDFSAGSNAAGMASELLNDYEEGTWTPVYTGSGGSIGATAYGTQTGTYTKVGRLVTIKCTVVLTNNGDWTGNIKITGIPFEPASPGTDVGTCYTSNVTFDGHLQALVQSGGVSILVSKTASSGTYLDCSGVPDSGNFVITISYTV